MHALNFQVCADIRFHEKQILNDVTRKFILHIFKKTNKIHVQIIQ